MSKVKDTNSNGDAFSNSTYQRIHMLSEHRYDFVNEHGAYSIKKRKQDNMKKKLIMIQNKVDSVRQLQ